MKILKLLTSLFIFFIFSAFIFAQKEENLDKWLKIKVLVSSLDDVEEIYGNGKEFALGKLYQTTDGNIYVQYTDTSDCKTSKIAVWNVPKWTVAEVSYSPSRNPPKLKDLIRSKNQFKKRQSGDVSDHIEYYNDEKGVSIIYDKSISKVIDITIRPSLEDKQKYSCK